MIVKTYIIFNNSIICALCPLSAHKYLYVKNIEKRFNINKLLFSSAPPYIYNLIGALSSSFFYVFIYFFPFYIYVVRTDVMHSEHFMLHICAAYSAYIIHVYIEAAQRRVPSLNFFRLYKFDSISAFLFVTLYLFSFHYMCTYAVR